jgi:predicted secreted Zn-dependent protease
VDEKGARAVGLTSYTPSLDWDSNHDPRACAISRMTIGVDLKVTLPALANLSQMAPALRSNWTTYAAGVSAHEQRHVDIWQRGAETIRQKMAEITPTVGCSALEARVLEVWKTQQDATSREQDLFHQQEFARLDAARAPLKSQIDANRGNLDSLTLQIAGLDASLATLSQQIDPLKNLMDSLQTQIRAIEEKYKGTSPPGDIYDQYQRLISQYNNLIPSFNALIGQYNSQVGQRSTLAAQAETLRIQTNDLVEQYNWVR